MPENDDLALSAPAVPDAPPPAGHNNPPHPAAERLEKFAAEAIALQNEIDTLSETLKAKSGKLAALLKSDILKSMEELGAKLWGSDDGTVSVAVEAKVAGSLAKAKNKDAALQYLRDNGWTAGIVTELGCVFPDQNYDAATKLATMIAETFGIDVAVERTVNPASLAKWARDRQKVGLPVDLAMVGLTTWREAKIKEL